MLVGRFSGLGEAGSCRPLSNPELVFCVYFSRLRETWNCGFTMPIDVFVIMFSGCALFEVVPNSRGVSFVGKESLRVV